MPTILQVALDTPLHRLFDYRLPDGLAAVQTGSLIEVPFGRTRQVGVALGRPTDSSVGTDKLRDVIRVLDDRPALSPDILRLAQFCADYYHYPLGAILLASLPPRLRNATPFVADAPWLVLTDAGRDAEPPARAKAQRVLLEALREGPQLRDALRAQKKSRHAAALVEAGWAEWTRLPPPTAHAPQTASCPAATPEQQAALDALLPSLAQFRVHLIHGVTGSGKTELYLRLIDAVLAQGGQALVLIPEIALTPQLEQHFRRRFPGRRFATLHSGLAETARAENWLAAPDCDVLLGTRLSVFAPLPRLGLIVVDEEHDGSFKQQDGLRYSARDVAVARGKQAAVPVVLGSATPSLETRYAAGGEGETARLVLSERIGARPLPEVLLVHH